MSLETCLVSLEFDQDDANELRQLAMRAADDASAVEQYIADLQADEQEIRDQLTQQGIDAQRPTIEEAVQEGAEVLQSAVQRATPEDLRQIDEALQEDIDTVAPILYQRYDMPDAEADGQRADGTHPFQMSTRVPSAKETAGQAEQAVHDGEPLSIGIEQVLQLPPEQLQKMATVLKSHAGFKTRSRKPEKVIEEYIEHVKDNLMWLHNLVAEQYPDLIERSHQWYDGARRITTEWAKIYGVPDRSVAAVLAALSPQMDWFKNVTLAQRVLDIHSHLTTGNTVAMPALDSMREWVGQKYAPRKRPKNWAKKSAKRKAEWNREEEANRKKLQEYRELFSGDKTYADLPEGREGDIQRAMWLRAYDEAENPKTYRLVTPEGAFGDLATNNDGTPASATWGSFREIAKAISALRDPSVEGISAFIGGEHKVRNFYNNILTPNSPRGEVTIDTHAVAAALMLPLGGSDLEVTQNFGGGGAPSSSVTGSQGIYGILAEAHRRAAADPSINRLPRQVQSITWEAIRSIFLPAFKNDANKDAVKAVWAQYERGAISKDAARSQIVEVAGGLRAPKWASSDDARDTATDPSRRASYDGELAVRNIRSRQYAEGFGFGDVSTGSGDTVGIGPQIRRTLFQRDGDGPQAPGERPDSDRLGRGGVADAFVSSKQGAVRLTGKNGRSRLKGLEKGSPGAVPGLREAAADYARQAGIEHDHQAEYARVDIERAQRIAQAYKDMQHAPNDPAVQASYDAMIRETIAQYEYILSLGYTFTPMVEGFENAYPTVREALEDLSVNKHLWFFPTDFGYGTRPGIELSLEEYGGEYPLADRSVWYGDANFAETGGRVFEMTPDEYLGQVRQLDMDEVSRENIDLLKEHMQSGGELDPVAIYADGKEDGRHRAHAAKELGIASIPVLDFRPDPLDAAENPLLAWTDYEINGQRLRANDIFRIVHDVFGHGVEGSLFRARGEENAWQAHIRLYSDEAAGAVTTETRGQNSWLNYGPMGEANRTALTEDTVFAEQKIGLMPEWTWREGRAVNEADAKQAHEERKAILEANAAIERTAPAPATKREQAVFGLRRRFVDAGSGRIRGVTGGRRRDGENGRLVASDELVSAFAQAGYSAPAVVETDAATFVKLIEQSKAESKFGAAVYVYPESAYEDMQLWVTDDGKAGFAVKPDGDIVSVFNLQGSPHKGVVPYFLALAVHQGGTKLDAFDTILPYLYGASGFVEVGRDTWNEEYKPDGWDYKTFESFAFGRPGVVYMEYRNAEKPYRSEADLTRALFQPDEVAQPSTAVEPDPLGATEFQPDKTIIKLFERADKSTFLHESGHVFVELIERMALAPNAPQRIRDIYTDMLKLVGAKSARDMDYTDPTKTKAEREAAVERQEILARSFEKYLMEGKAPSPQLKTAFATFRRWLTFIYTRLRRLGTTLSPEVSSVFDRMLATDEELQMMREIAGVDANASPTIAAMMEGPEAARYVAAQEEAEELDRERLLLIDAEIQQAEKEKAWQEAYEAERKNVAAELWAMEQYKAWLFLTSATLPPEPNAPDRQVKLRQRLQGKRLSKKAFLDAGFTAQELADIPRGPRGRAVYTRDSDGIDPGALAEALGYEDAVSLLESMRDLAPPQEAIDAEATRRVKAKLGDPANDGTRERLLKESLYHESRQKVIIAELNALAEAAGKPSTTRALAKAMADEIISATPLAQLLSPLKYEAASVRHAQEAERRAAAGDVLGAYESKMRHLLNHELFRKSLNIRDNVNNQRKRLRKLQTKKIDPQRVAPEYIGQIKTLLSIFGLKESPKQWQAAGRITPEMQALATSVMSWIDGKQAQGEALSVPGELLTVGNFDENGDQPTAFMLKHWSEMTAKEFAALNALTSMIENMGRRNSDAERMQRKMQYMRLAQGIEQATKAKPRRQVQKGRIPTAKEEEATGIRKWFQFSHRKLESMLRQLDGFVDLGPMWQAVFKPLQDGENVKDELSATIVKSIDKIFSVYSVDERRRMRSDGSSWYSANFAFGSAKQVPGIRANVSMTHEERLVIALNAGNESSRQALLDDKQLKDWFTPRDSNGNAIGETEWGEAALQSVLDMLSDKDRKVVQEIFDLVDSFWEDVYDSNGNLVTIGIKSLEKQQSGVVPPKVKALPFTSNGHTIKGGYYPLKYNPHASEQVAREGEMDIASALAGGYPGSAMTAHNHTIARKGSGGRPIRLGLDVLMNHFEQVTHDLAFRQAVVNADRILTDSGVSNAIKNELGESGLREMRKTIITVAQGRAAPITPAGKIARSIRLKASNAIMGLNLRSILSQPLGLMQSLSALGPVYMARGFIQWYVTGSDQGAHLGSMRAPFWNRSLTRQVFAKSVFMRNRARVATRELNEVQNKIEIEMLGAAKRTMQRAAFAPMILLDVYSVSMPTWLGAYEKAMAGKVKNAARGDEAAAIAYADSIVRRTQGTGGNLNLSTIQSQDELSKLMTMFGSYFNTTYNLQAEAWNQWRQSEGFVEGTKNFAGWLYHSILLTLIPGAIGAIILENYTEEDEEKLTYGEWLLMHTALYAAGQMFIVRDIATGVASGFEPSFTPAESVYSAVVGAGKEVGEMLMDEDYEADLRSAKVLARGIGYAGGIPGTNQIIRSTEWLAKYESGDLKNPVEDVWSLEGMQRVLMTGDR